MTAPGDTIAALASPPGGGPRGVVRVSGPDARRLAAATLRRGGRALELGERAVLEARFDDGRGTQPALVLWMPGPASYTREDVLELHLCGNPALLDAALARLLALGARAAGPGEFTRRAFESGRLDLTRAEGVLELVRARGLEASRAAAALLFGGLAERVEHLREGLVELRALCEASLDFDESETGHVPAPELARRADELEAELVRAAAWEERREAPGGAPRVVLAGAPNAGKSTLFNALVSGGRALTGPLGGTTRDGVRGTLELGGREVELLDAPGLEPGDGEPDRRAQALARGAREGADLLLLVVDPAKTSERDLAARARGLPPCPGILVWSKADLGAPAPHVADGSEPWRRWRRVPVSAREGLGLEALREALAEALGLDAGGEGAGASRELSARHRGALEHALRELRDARERLAAGAPLDLVAEGLRAATDALDEVCGRTAPEDLLDRIFARFCLGK